MTTPVASPRHVRWARYALVADAWLLAAALLGQFFVAGLAVFVGPEWWPRHLAFVHAFQWLSPAAFVLAFLGRSPRGVKVLATLTLVQLSLQYTTAEQRLIAGRQAWAALHPVNGVLLFWTTAELARRAWRRRE